jgi:hypothetical protein
MKNSEKIIILQHKFRIMKNLTLFVTAAIILFGGGVYLYYYFFRQVNAKLIETIPTDAAFIFQINDNETFLKSIKTIHPYINPLFGLDAYPGCQFFVDQLPGKYNQVIFSGHANGEALAILFACKINERAFEHLLSKLQIDVKNCQKFEQCKIYTFGTHLKRFVFTYHKGIFVASENMILLKKAIAQLKNPKNLTTLKSFSTLFNITEKNKKQNWLILNHERYFSGFERYFNHDTNSSLAQFSSSVPWSAYQVRFTGLEMLLAGYISVNSNFQNYFSNLEPKYLYYSSLNNSHESIDYEKDHHLKYAKLALPSQNDFELAIHAANSEYWERYLSELGMTKFAVAQMRLFAFSMQVETSTSLQIANGFIKF